MRSVRYEPGDHQVDLDRHARHHAELLAVAAELGAVGAHRDGVAEAAFPRVDHCVGGDPLDGPGERAEA